jgi:lysosomal Pro-X carboxypeptidase
MKYPHLVEGAVASSAPIFLPFGVIPEPVGTDFAVTVTTLMGETCARRLKNSLRLITKLSQTQDGSSRAKQSLGICKKDSGDLTRWASSPWGFLAMGNYPYANAYIPTTAGVGSAPLPPNPLNAACAILTRSVDESDEALLGSVRDALQMWYNGTGTETCFHTAAAQPRAGIRKSKCYGDYSFQRCAELAGPYQHGTSRDAFWPPLVVDEQSLTEQCLATYGMSPRIGAAAVEFGGSVRDTVAGMSNIIWSNGEFDPWRKYGVDCREVDCPASVFSPFVRGGAHSSDLMFAHPLDSSDLEEVRRVEYAHISSWIEAKTLRYAGVRPQNPRPTGAFPHVVLAN